MGIQISEQTRLLRKLALHGEIISSHILHIYFLAGPDFMGVNSLFDLAASDKDFVLRAMRLKGLGYEISSAVAGRHTHPVGMRVGGFSFVHDPESLERVRERLEQALEDLSRTADFMKGLEIPDFQRETEYVAITDPDEYALYQGELYSDKAGKIPVSEYRNNIKEYVVPNSTAKFAKWKTDDYMVGALARFNINHDKLTPMAGEVAQELGLSRPCHNPFLNTFAQLVECFHCAQDSVSIIGKILDSGIRPEDESSLFEEGEGKAAAAVEAPRGTLIHEYHYDEEGVCSFANHLIPTAQNLASIQADLKKLIEPIVDRDREHIQKMLEMLVRAYDPCISCSTHSIVLEKGGFSGKS
jgi:coenzyme F420-reducing hydrogenase alpha subunit